MTNKTRKKIIYIKIEKANNLNCSCSWSINIFLVDKNILKKDITN